MKKILMFLVLLLGPIISVDATTISNINMDIYVEYNGDAIIKETWNANVKEGTEGYHPYYNIGNSTITDLEVTMDNSKFTTISNWDINASFDDKAYKAGIYYLNDEIDLCFGISNYGSHTYTIQYKITGFVANLIDSEMIYWNLFPKNFSAEPNNVNISIHSDFLYKTETKIYTYGKANSKNSLSSGKIYINSNDKIRSNEYLTVLIKFPKGTFNSSNTLNNYFDNYYNMAKEGAVNYSDTPKSFFIKIFDSIINLFKSLFGYIVITIIVLILCIKKSSKTYKCRFGSIGNKVPSNINNFREIPCNKDIFRAYWVAYNYNLTEKKEDFLGALLLKWLKEGYVKVEKIEKNKPLSKKEKNNIIFINKPTNGIEIENKLYDWMYEASSDGKLESNEFNKWCRKNYKKILEWFDEVIEFESKKLVNEGKAKITTEKKIAIFEFNYYDIDPSMMEEAKQMAGLKKFLKEFTLINQREAIEVNLWDEYLIYAQIFGIADKVAKQFEKLYPEIKETMTNYGYDYDDFFFIYMISNDSINSAINSYFSESSSYGSGGGGGGSFGGGGGGGGFR